MLVTFRVIAAALGASAALAVPTAARADTAGLVAAYGFDEASGTTVADSSSAGNAGTLSGAVRSASGKFGPALSFDGVNDMSRSPTRVRSTWRAG